MTAEPFRFIHAADFHLEQPVYGLTHAPDHLRDIFIDAPYLAAEKVFESAIVEEVDFVILSGDIVDCDVAGPRSVAFLLEQFQRLGQREIAVYWCGGQVDPPKSWPTEIELPANVHLFRQGKAEELTHYRGETPLTTIIGKSRQGRRRLRPADFRVYHNEPFSIAVANGTSDTELLKKSHLSYWALGGLHHRATISESPHTVHYPGTPQGRCPDEQGAHGATLIDVNDRGHARIHFVATDVVRSQVEHLQLEQGATKKKLRALLSEATSDLISNTTQCVQLVSWVIQPQGSLAPCLRGSGLENELLTTLRNDCSHAQPTFWNASLELKPPADLTSGWLEEKTILGDFMRSVRQIQESSEATIDLDDYLSPKHAAGTLGEAVALNDSQDRDGALSEAAALAVELLHGGDRDESSQKS